VRYDKEIEDVHKEYMAVIRKHGIQNLPIDDDLKNEVRAPDTDEEEAEAAAEGQEKQGEVG